MNDKYLFMLFLSRRSTRDTSGPQDSRPIRYSGHCKQTRRLY